jgi:hypothetical protein
MQRREDAFGQELVIRLFANPGTVAQMITDYEDELARLTDNPDGLEKEQDDIDESIDRLQATIRSMEGKINTTTATASLPALPRHTIGEAIAALDARFPWLRGAESHVSPGKATPEQILSGFNRSRPTSPRSLRWINTIRHSSARSHRYWSRLAACLRNGIGRCECAGTAGWVLDLDESPTVLFA